MNYIATATEDALLATFAQFPDTLVRNIHAITGEMFAQQNRPVFREVLEAALAGQHPDLLIITAKLRQANELEAVGGAAQMSELWTAPVSPRNAQKLIADLRRCHEARKRLEALKSAQECLETAMLSGSSLLEAFQQTENMLAEAGKIPGKALASKSMKILAGELIDELEDRLANAGRIPGVSTGFPTIDRESGGMQGGKVWVVCGRPGDGKSVLMQNFCESAIEQGRSVRIYPLEMSQAEQAFRVLCSTGGIDNQSMGRGTLTRTEQEAMALALKRMSAMKADIVDVDGATASDILHDIEQCDADVIMVDYLQLMEDTGPRKGATREEIIASVSRRLKRTAKKSNKIVLTASQLNDNGQLRESRAIGQDADAVFRIEKIDGKDDARTLICDKLRGGKRLWTKQLDFLGHIYKFREPIM
jgi:replicative DNA helicase